MRVMDAQQQLAWDSEISAAVVGKDEEVLLIPLDEDICAAVETAKARGFYFFGIMGYAYGRVDSKSQPNLEAMCGMAFAAGAFAELVVKRLRRCGPCVDELERLYALPDTRD
jgi:hypothetical protein